jgi:hypothetical protein
MRDPPGFVIDQLLLMGDRVTEPASTNIVGSFFVVLRAHREVEALAKAGASNGCGSRVVRR